MTGQDRLAQLVRAGVLHNWAGLLYDAAKYSEALEYNEKALAISKATLGDNHPSTATAYYVVALVHYEMGEHDQALSAMQAAHAAYLACLGPDHPATINAADTLQDWS